MKLTVRGFKKVTLAKYSNIVQQPLLAISKNDQKTLKVEPGMININNYTVRLITGTKDGFVGLTKTLRRLLKVEKGDVVNITIKNGQLTCIR